MEGSAERVGTDECTNFSAKATRIPIIALGTECSCLSHSSHGARPGVGLRCGQWLLRPCMAHTCGCLCQRADSGGRASLWIIKTEPAIACRCESGEWREGKATWTRCKVSVLVCDQAEHEVTLW